MNSGLNGENRRACAIGDWGIPALAGSVFIGDNCLLLYKGNSMSPNDSEMRYKQEELG